MRSWRRSPDWFDGPHGFYHETVGGSAYYSGPPSVSGAGYSGASPWRFTERMSVR